MSANPTARVSEASTRSATTPDDRSPGRLSQVGRSHRCALEQYLRHKLLSKNLLRASDVQCEELPSYESELNALADNERLLIVARAELGYSYAQIAAALGYRSPSAARSSLVRALARFGASGSSTDESNRLYGVAAAVADGAHVDWQRLTSVSATDGERRAIGKLQHVAVKVRSFTPSQLTSTRNPQAERVHPAAAFWMVIVIAISLLQAVLALLTEVANLNAALPSTAIRHGQFAAVIAYVMAGAILLYGGRTDRRAAFLGAFFIMVASAFAQPFLGWIKAALPIASRVHPDAFLPLFLWLFVREFPRPFRFSRTEHIADIAVLVSACVGTTLIVINLLTPASGNGFMPSALELLRRNHRYSLYWAVVFVLLAPALPFAHLRRLDASVEERRRLGVFTWGLLIGGVPTLLLVVIEIAFPRLRPFLVEHRPAAASLVFASATAIPFVAAYAVLVNRILDVRWVYRRAHRQLIERGVVVVVCLTPFVILLNHIRHHQDLSVAGIASDFTSRTLAFACAGAVVLFASRRRLLALLDTRYFPDTSHDRELVETATLLHMAASTKEVGDTVIAGLLGSIRETPSLLCADRRSTTTDLVAIAGAARRLPSYSALVVALVSEPAPMTVDPEDRRSLFCLLPDEDAKWVVDCGASVVIPAMDSTGVLIGILVVGRRRDDLPLTRDQLTLVAVLAKAVGLALERVSISGRRTAQGAFHTEMSDVAALECIACRHVVPPTDIRCIRCGGVLESTHVPVVVAGKFKIDCRLGEGGMGVVYCATDIGLGRTVAIKTLPRISLDAVVRLQREARAMATVTHPNLATIFGVETWRGRPLLVVEYLDGGTLAARLLRGRLDVCEALRIGIAMAAGLQTLHRARLLHRDVKPSNIGFAADGTCKLLDFGLAKLLPFAPEEPNDVPNSSHTRPSTTQTSLTGPRIVGTVLYMSPEVISGRPATASDDLWALAMVLFEGLTGAHPFRAATREETFARVRRGIVPSIRDLRPELSGSLSAFFDIALQRDPARRPRSAGHMREMLQSAEALPVTAQRGLRSE